MNDSGMREDGLHEACLSLGSNIQPEKNIPKAVALLRSYTLVTAISQSWETPAVGSAGPNFINLAVRLRSPLDAAALKNQIITSIESALGRVRTADKNAPRTIDLDIVIFDGTVLDDHLWQRVYLALPVSELYPQLLHPTSGQRLEQVAQALFKAEPVQARPEILDQPGA